MMTTKHRSQDYLNLQDLQARTTSYATDRSQEEPLEPKTEQQDDKEGLGSQRPWWHTVLVQIFALSWIAPIMALLVLNFQGYIIGPTAWCPSGHCYAETFSVDTLKMQEHLRKYDENNHNLLGALQLVAKALEVWFEVIAGLLVYLCTLEVASCKEGLAIGYLMSPFEFSRLPALFDFLLWKIAPGLGKAKSRSARVYRRRIYLLLLLVLCLCAVCNLMGPATAVLVLPTLQWVDTAEYGNLTFQSMNSAEPPQANNWFIEKSNCTPADASASNFSCAAPTFGSGLDVWLDSIIQYAPGVTQQDQLTFNINTTFTINNARSLEAQYNSSVYWAPNREIISNLSNDYLGVGLLSLGVDMSEWQELGGSLEDFNSYTEYNESLNLDILRNGPILGAIINNWNTFDNVSLWAVDVGPDQHIRCYDRYSLSSLDQSATGNYTKCLRTGSGWSPSNKMANFSIAGIYDYSANRVQPGVDVQLFSSDKAAFLPNGVLPDWLPAVCLNNGTLPADADCDFERLFTVDPSSPVANRSTNVNTLEMRISEGNASVLVAIDFVSFLGFTTYSLDASPVTNPSAIVQTQDIANTQTSIAIDPAWVLAALSANPGVDQLPDRPAPRMMVNLMSSFLDVAKAPNPTTDKLSDLASDWYYYFTIISAAQTLSIIDIASTPTSSRPQKDDDPLHPLLQRNARMNVWAYNISSSRTAKLGAAVAIIGILVTLTQFVLSLVDRRPFRSATQMMVAALEHTPRNEFTGRENEKASARVRFHIKESSDHTAGKLRFHPTDG